MVSRSHLRPRAPSYSVSFALLCVQRHKYLSCVFKIECYTEHFSSHVRLVRRLLEEQDKVFRCYRAEKWGGQNKQGAGGEKTGQRGNIQVHRGNIQVHTHTLSNRHMSHTHTEGVGNQIQRYTRKQYTHKQVGLFDQDRWGGRPCEHRTAWVCLGYPRHQSFLSSSSSVSAKSIDLSKSRTTATC